MKGKNPKNKTISLAAFLIVFVKVHINSQSIYYLSSSAILLYL